MLNLSGIYPPIATPFKDGEVDYAGLAHNTTRWMQTGLRGLLALGSNGEAAFVDEDEAERIVATVREGVPRDRVLLAGTGRQSTRATIAATKRAAKAGADAVLVLTPFYFKSQMTHDALVTHYRAVADASPVPVLLYNFTNVTAMNMSPDTVAALSAHPNIVGIKDSNGDVGQVAAIVARTPPAFTVVVGSAATLTRRSSSARPARSWRWPTWCRTCACGCSTSCAPAGTTRRRRCSGGSRRSRRR